MAISLLSLFRLERLRNTMLPLVFQVTLRFFLQGAACDVGVHILFFISCIVPSAVFIFLSAA